MSLTPEQQARERIDVQLAACAWIVQDMGKAHQVFGGNLQVLLDEPNNALAA
jgi:hypothetical protein